MNIAIGFVVCESSSNGIYLVDILDKSLVDEGEIIKEVWVKKPEYREQWLNLFRDIQRLKAQNSLLNYSIVQGLEYRLRDMEAVSPEIVQVTDVSISEQVLTALQNAPIIMQAVGPIKVGKMLSYTTSVPRFFAECNQYFWAVDVTFERNDCDKRLSLRIFIARKYDSAVYYPLVAQILHTPCILYLYFMQDGNWVRWNSDMSREFPDYKNYVL